MEATLSKSASAPGLRASEQGSSLRAAGATTLYEKMKTEGKFREQWPNVRPAGRSIVTAAYGADSLVDRLLTPPQMRKFRRTSQIPGEIRSHWGLTDQKLPAEDHRYGQPGVQGISTESTMKAGQLAGVAEYKNSVSERVYESTKKKPLGTFFSRSYEGMRVPDKGFGKKEYDVADAENIPGQPARCPFPRDLNPSAEQDRVNLSFTVGNVDSKKMLDSPKLLKNFEAQVSDTIRAQCGEVRIRPKDVSIQLSSGSDGMVVKVQIDPPEAVSPESVATKLQDLSGLSEALAQNVPKIFGMDKLCSGPVQLLSASAPEVVRGTRAMYKFSHNVYLPGEQSTRKYVYPEEVHGPNFRFGGDKVSAVSGAGARLALDMTLEDNGDVVKTRISTKTCEDYRNVKHPKAFQSQHYLQGSTGPPVPQGFAFGVKTEAGLVTAEQCLQGSYTLQEQLPDQDLGRCTKPGRRNVTTETRAFGIPSIRSDIPPPSGVRSMADLVSYGDDCGAAALLGPQRFDERGVPDAEFLIRRPKQELASLLQVAAPEVDLESLWPQCLSLFEDGLQLVSLDAVLFVHSQKVDQQISQRLNAFETTLGAGAASRGLAKSSAAAF
jgi:hypothetical protein